MLPITKLYVDSRFKSSDSVSDSDFKIGRIKIPS